MNLGSKKKFQKKQFTSCIYYDENSGRLFEKHPFPSIPGFKIIIVYKIEGEYFSSLHLLLPNNKFSRTN